LYKLQNNYFRLACLEFVWHIHIVTSNELTQVEISSKNCGQTSQ